MSEAASSERPRVSVPLIRLFRWSLVDLFAFAFLTGENLVRAMITGRKCALGPQDVA